MLELPKIFFLLLILSAVYYPIYPGLWNDWLSHSNNSHGVLVPLISGYFIWDRRGELSKTKIYNSRIGLLIFVASLIVYLVALLGGVSFVSRLMIVFTLVGTVLSLWGFEVFKVIRFPLFFLLFMVPVPHSIINYIALPLQIFATKISAILIDVVGIPVYREGNMLYFVQTQLEVAEACSGIRSIVALTMLSTIFIYFSRLGKLQNILLLSSAIPIALFANILRVSGIGVLAHFFGGRVARGFMHDFSGIAVFMFGLLILTLEFSILSSLYNRTKRLSGTVNE